MDDETQPVAPGEGVARRGTGSIRVGARAIRVHYQVAASSAGRLAGSAIILSGALFWSHEPLELETDAGERLIIRLTHASGRLLRFDGASDAA